jgi:hypothetical protein
MLSRSVTVPTLLAASVAVPYVASNAAKWRQQWNTGSAPAASTALAPTSAFDGLAASQRTAALIAPPQGPGAALYPAQTPLEGVATYSLADVLRMDVSKEWVYQRWPRKSTALSELDLFGVRVPLVTGTQLYDLAGSLTYFFGVDGRVHRISFRGRTGDTTQLLGLVTLRYGLQPQPSVVAGEQLYQLRRGDHVLSQVRTRPAPVLWASTPHDSFAVELELQDPATARPLSSPYQELPGLKAGTPPATAASAAKSSGQNSVAATEGSEQAKSSESTWKTFFPRRRVPKAQIRNLDHGNIYR